MLDAKRCLMWVPLALAACATTPNPTQQRAQLLETLPVVGLPRVDHRYVYKLIRGLKRFLRAFCEYRR